MIVHNTPPDGCIGCWGKESWQHDCVRHDRFRRIDPLDEGGLESITYHQKIEEKIGIQALKGQNFPSGWSLPSFRNPDSNWDIRCCSPS